MKIKIIRREFVFEPGQVPFCSVHASTIALHNGCLHAAWFGGSGEDKTDDANLDVISHRARLVAARLGHPRRRRRALEPCALL